MKRIFSLIFLIGFGTNVFAQNGNGSSGNPFWGTITSTARWSTGDPNYGSTVYVGTTSNPDLTIGNSGHLTVDPGITVIFTELSSDMIITGSGILTAVGTSSDSIFFTKASAKSHWGHISFETPGSGSPISGTGSFEYCRVEYGYAATSGTDPSNAGGGIQVNASDVTIYNCLFKNNYSNYGGALTVNAGRNTTIKKCRFKSNSSNEAGGALLLWTGSTATVENCIFERNHSTGASSSVYSGGAIWVYGNSSKIVNCTFVNNTSDHPGDAIYSLSSSSAIILNSIFCGSSGQFASNITSYIVSYCAFETSKPANSTNSIILDSGNGGNGPNFTDPSTSDYSITFISPCRDAGTTPSPPIPNDILGNPRVGPYDIGAYEVQPPRWTGATNGDWSTPGNWSINIVPPAGSDVVIGPSTNNPTITVSDVTLGNLVTESGSSLTLSNHRILTATTVESSGALNINNSSIFNATSLTNEGAFTLNPGAWSTIITLTNNGTINLISDIVDMFSLLINTYSGTGTANIAMTLSGGGAPGQWAWHYVAIPTVPRIDKTVFTSIDPLNLMAYSDFYIPDTPTASDNDGWIWHDGYLAGPPPSMNGPSFSNLFPGTGYAFYHSTTSTVNFSNLTSLLSNLGSLTLQYNGTGKLVPANYGYNLMGNSLTCGIDWNLVTETGNINDAIYYTINYKIGMYVRAAPSGINGATKDIPPLQGFLVKTNGTGTSLDFSSAREHTGQLRYKKSLELKGSDSKGSGSVDPMIKLELNNSGNQDETLIWFNDKATNAFDGDFDASKLFSGGAFDQIYTWNGSQKFGISGIPFPTESVTIPVAVKIINAGSNYKIIASQLQGLDNYNVTLTDNGNASFITDLKNTGSYTFSSDAGTFPDRFVLTIGTIATGVSDVIIPDKAFNVFAFDKTLNIDLLNADWEGKSGTISIYNLTGLKVLQQNNVEWYKGDIKKIPLNLPQGIYIVEIKAENQKFVTKINIIK